jgi:hypothetical protein
MHCSPQNLEYQSRLARNRIQFERYIQGYVPVRWRIVAKMDELQRQYTCFDPLLTETWHTGAPHWNSEEEGNGW